MKNNYLILIIINFLLLFSFTNCSQKKEPNLPKDSIDQDSQDLNEMISKLKVYENPDRIAPNCSEINAKETDGKYAKELTGYSGMIKVCNEQNKVITLYKLKNGKHEGCFYTYDEAGFLMGKTNYSNDQKNGEMIKLDEVGRIVINAKFKKDKLIECEGLLCDELKNIYK
jgi:antitoxin component YwqK of YwqJK toxin-antitoxin module